MQFALKREKLDSRFVQKDSKIVKWETWTAVIMLFLLSMPYFMWHSRVPILVWILLFLAASLRHIRITRNSLKIVVPLFVLYFIFLSRGLLNVFGWISVLLIPMLFLIDSRFLLRIIKNYILLFSGIMGLSLIIYFLVGFLGVNLPHNTIPPLWHLKTYTYLQYPFLVMPDVINIGIVRFCGVYDEPGVVGSIAAVLLCGQRYDLKKWYNIPILIGGILSFSFFFYTITGLYILLFAKVKYKIFILLLLLVLVPVLYQNEDLYHLVFRRFEYSEGSFVGDNRTTESFDIWYKKFRNSSDYLWGLGGGVGEYYNQAEASYKVLLVNNGLIWFTMYIIVFFLYAVQNFKISKNCLLYMILFLGYIYQRPSIGTFFIIFLFIGFALLLKDTKEKKSTL